MKKWLLGIACASLVLTLVGCDKDNSLPPTPLSKIAPDVIHINTLWTADAGNGTAGQYLSLQPVIFGTTLATTSYEGEVKAFNVQTGEKRWFVDMPFQIGSGAAVSQTMIVVGGLNGQVVALASNDGHQLWAAQMASSLLAPAAISGGSVVLHVHNGDVVALDALTGKQRWIQSSTTPALSLASNSQPVIVGKKVLVGFDNGVITAFKLNSGQIAWSRPIAIASGDTEISRMIDIVSTPVVSKGVVYAAAYHGNVVALQLKNGSLLWEHPFSSYTNLALASDRLIATDDAGAVSALDLETGRVLWVQKALLQRSVTAPAVVNTNDVIVGDYAGYVHWLSLSDGSLLARTQISGKGIIAQAAVANGVAFVVSNNGDLVALKPSK